MITPPRPVSPWLMLGCTAVVTTTIAPPLRRWLLRIGMVDVPNHRSSHVAAVPRGGGIAGLAGATVVALASDSRLTDRKSLAVVVAATLGFMDDASGHLNSGIRLAGQLASGLLSSDSSGPLRGFDAVVTAGIINVVNFMDGINGISGATAVTWGVNALVNQDGSDHRLAVIGGLVAGAGLGFLPYNMFRTRLFLGDVGSYALGSAMAVGILSQPSVASRYRVGSPLLLYGVDAAQALAGRALTGRRIGAPHRDHVYQRLVDAGVTHHAVAFSHATLAACVAALAANPSPSRVVATTAICSLYLSLPRLRSSLVQILHNATPGITTRSSSTRPWLPNAAPGSTS